MPFNKYKRESFYKKEVVEGKIENDFSTNKFNEFKLTRPSFFYTIKEVDIKRPDILAKKLYDNQNYWWMIFKFNNIVDPYHDLEAGDVIRVPNKLDLDEFVTQTKVN